MRALFPVLLFLLLVSACTPPTAMNKNSGDRIVTKTIDGNGHTGISGKILQKANGTPLIGAYVNIYPNTISNLLGPSQFISAPSRADGSYSIDLPPGEYYIVARKRTSGLANGPLATGDYYSEHQRIIARVAEGKLTQVDLNMARMKAPMFFKKDLAETRTDTGVRGVLRDAQGKPVPGGFAIAYTDNNLQRLPDYASTLTNQQGEFTLYLPAGGQYFLAARIHAWDMPREGELYGKYGGENPVAMEVADKSFVEGVEIRMAPFSGTYKEMKNQRPF